MKFKEFCKFQEGYVNPTQKKTEFFDGPIKWLRATDLNNGLVYDTSRTLSEEGFKSAGKSSKLFKPDSIAISKSGTIGRLGILKDFMCGNRAVINIEVDKELMDPMYVFYWLLNNHSSIQELAVGSVQKNLYVSAIENLDIEFKTLEEQRRISKVIQSIDLKIDNNSKIIRILELKSELLFKRWFIDFEFPDETGYPYKSSGGEMIESELGKIPKGWDLHFFKDMYSNFDRKRIPLSKRERELRDNIYPYYGAASLMDYVDDFIFDGTYVLLGEDGTVSTSDGKPVLQYVWGKFWVNNHAHVIQGKNHFSTEYIYLLLKHTNIESIITGAVQKKISQGNLNSLKMIKPEQSVLSEFSELISLFFEIVKIKSEEISTLTKMRDSLLPKLLSGEIEVSVLEPEQV